MTCDPACETPRDDWASDWRALLAWWLPSAALIASGFAGPGYSSVIWPVALSVMGVACWLNARRCGRRHCYVTAPFFLLLALVAMLDALDVISLGRNGWNVLVVVLVVGGCALTWLPDRLFGRYRSAARREQV